jgi:hypothetical protein
MAAERKRMIEKAVRNKHKKYVRWCKETNTATKSEDMDNIYRKECKNRRIVDILEPDKALIQHYSNMIVDLWFWMGRSPYIQKKMDEKTRACIHFRPHILGTLYLVQYGVSIDDHVLIKQDMFLFKQLPPVHDIKRYGHHMHKKHICIGKNLIMNCVRSFPACEYSKCPVSVKVCKQV